jgi:hypothetical protein
MMPDPEPEPLEVTSSTRTTDGSTALETASMLAPLRFDPKLNGTEGAVVVVTAAVGVVPSGPLT